MTTVNITEVKKNLAHLLAEETEGEEIIIIAGNRPVGIIQPIKALTPLRTPPGKSTAKKILPPAE